MGRSRANWPPARGRAINVPLQHLHIGRRFPGFALAHVPGAAEWRGTLQPRPASPAYKMAVRVGNRVGEVPQARVIWPILVPDAPHLYTDGTLCLYWPSEWSWQCDDLIAETILPWTALWLYYYELWLDCGEWLGPSSHDHMPERSNPK